MARKRTPEALTDERIVEELKKIAGKSGRTTPAAIVEAAKPANHPLHLKFEWDDSKAGHKYRISQAQALLAIRVEVRNKKTTLDAPMRPATRVPEFVRDPRVKGDEPGYVTRSELAKDPDDVRATVIYEFVRAGSILKRARDLARSFEMDGEIDGLIRSLDGLRTRLVATVAGNA
jgi:hypothetical protein